MHKPLPIAVLTDFGYTDAYVGIMKGVILTRCGDACLIDLTHGVPPQDVFAGALHLASAVSYCPQGTIFLAVVDPGVGGARRPLCIRSGDHSFVGPDNGLLWPAADQVGTPEAFHLDRPQYWLPQPGSTFHGRDIFAPVAALLALGHPPEELGSPIADPVRLEPPRPVETPAGIQGEVIYVDHYGNAVTNLQPKDLQNPVPNTVAFQMKGHTLRGPSSHYGAVPPGHAVVVLGSFGFYEIAINGGNAATTLGLKRGATIAVQLSATPQ